MEIYRGYTIEWNSGEQLHEIKKDGQKVILKKFISIDNAFDWIDREKRRTATSAFEG